MPKGAKRTQEPDEKPADQSESGIDRLRRRALELARVQATDDEIAAALRDELGSGPAPVVTKGKVTRVVTDLGRGRTLNDARVAGRLAPVELLFERARDGDTTAAVQLHRRQEMLDGLDKELLREVKRILALEPSAIAAELAALGTKLGA